MVVCPYHDDTNPSMFLYPTHGHCFVCNAHIPIEKLGIPGIQVTRKPTDLQAMLSYIQQLPTRQIRGLTLPFDSSGYYIVWPNGKFYVKRTWSGDARYISPRGIQRPLFTSGKKSDIIVIVEGELNAVSLKESVGEVGVDIVSPGSAPNVSKFIDIYLQYRTIILLMDKDAVGVVYGLDLKERLLKARKRVIFEALEKDFNQTLQEEGKEGVKAQFARALGMQDMPRVG